MGLSLVEQVVVLLAPPFLHVAGVVVVLAATTAFPVVVLSLPPSSQAMSLPPQLGHLLVLPTLIVAVLLYLALAVIPGGAGSWQRLFYPLPRLLLWRCGLRRRF